MAQLDRKVDDALYAVDHFSALLDKETVALNNSDFATFEMLQDKKYELAQTYQDAILAFEQDVEELSHMDDSAKEKLRAAHTRFSVAAEVNQTALQAAAKISERIVDLVINAAKRTVMDTPNYGSGGLQDLSDKIPVHFKLNEVL